MSQGALQRAEVTGKASSRIGHVTLAAELSTELSSLLGDRPQCRDDPSPSHQQHEAGQQPQRRHQLQAWPDVSRAVERSVRSETTRP